MKRWRMIGLPTGHHCRWAPTIVWRAPSSSPLLLLPTERSKWLLAHRECVHELLSFATLINFAFYVHMPCVWGRMDTILIPRAIKWTPVISEPVQALSCTRWVIFNAISSVDDGCSCPPEPLYFVTMGMAHPVWWQVHCSPTMLDLLGYMNKWVWHRSYMVWVWYSILTF